MAIFDRNFRHMFDRNIKTTFDANVKAIFDAKEKNAKIKLSIVSKRGALYFILFFNEDHEIV